MARTTTASKGPIVLTGSAIAAVLGFGGWDKASDILKELTAVKTSQVALTGEVSALKQVVELKIGNGDTRQAETQHKVEDHESRLRLLENALAAQMAAATASNK